METKVCKWCSTEKPINLFHKNKKGKYGVSHVCKDCACEYVRIWRENNLLKVRASRYGITEDEVMELSSRLKCDICGVKEADSRRRLNIDHCHNSKRIRGYLCDDCNLGLSRFKDSQQLLLNAAAYLGKKE